MLETRPVTSPNAVVETRAGPTGCHACPRETAPDWRQHIPVPRPRLHQFRIRAAPSQASLR